MVFYSGRGTETDSLVWGRKSALLFGSRISLLHHDQGRKNKSLVPEKKAHGFLENFSILISFVWKISCRCLTDNCQGWVTLCNLLPKCSKMFVGSLGSKFLHFLVTWLQPRNHYGWKWKSCLGQETSTLFGRASLALCLAPALSHTSGGAAFPTGEFIFHLK